MSMRSMYLAILALLSMNLYLMYSDAPVAPAIIEQYSSDQEFLDCSKCTIVKESQYPEESEYIKYSEKLVEDIPVNNLNSIEPDDLTAYETDIPEYQSQMVVYEHNQNIDNFNNLNRQGKLDTIELLSAQGKDLEFIKKLINGNESEEYKIKAINKLKSSQSYGVTDALIKALESSEVNVSLTALNILVDNGDRSLIPLLESKVDKQQKGLYRDQYVKSINRLKLSASMDMDGLGN